MNEKISVMKTKLISVLMAMALIASFATIGCERDEETNALTGEPGNARTGRAHLQVRIMDAPSPYRFEAANIDIKAVNIYLEPIATGQRPYWLSLNIRGGVHDMLSLVNGTDLLLADQYIEDGKITQVAFVLGPNNSVVIDGREQHLVTSGTSSMAVVNTNFNITADAPLLMMLDFDAARSIKQQTDAYLLRPVIRAVDIERTGAIHGKTNVLRRGTAVFALDSRGVEYSTFVDRTTGEFLLRGLPSGMYSVRIYNPASDIPSVYDGIKVEGNQTSELTVTHFP
jgi:hypothetical protein